MINTKYIKYLNGIIKYLLKIKKNEFEENKTIEKIKIAFKKDEDEKDKIIYEVSHMLKEWDFKRHIKNMFKRIKEYFPYFSDHQNLATPHPFGKLVSLNLATR